MIGGRRPWNFYSIGKRPEAGTSRPSQRGLADTKHSIHHGLDRLGSRRNRLGRVKPRSRLALAQLRDLALALCLLALPLGGQTP
jgi:hypothetical protein